MPTVPFHAVYDDPRLTDQKWLLDLVIDLYGPNWDQGRLGYYALPCSPDHKAAILALQGKIKKLDDFTRECVKVARFFELRGKKQAARGHDRSAGDDLFAASIMYGAAQWPIFVRTELFSALEAKKVECYSGYAERADHYVEAVEVPYQGRSVPGWFHLPPGHTAGSTASLPCVVQVSGMDAFKELSLFASGDRYLARGMAVLVIDGPGQGSCLDREIWYDPATYGELGVSAYETVAARPEVDPDRVMMWGLSQGSFWATQMAAAENRYAACCVMYTCFDPGNRAMFSTQSPTFTRRFMFMIGVDSVEALEKIAQGMDVRPLSGSLTMPYLVIAGEDDPLTDLEQTYQHLNNVPGVKELLLYTGEDHAPVTRSSGQLGPNHAIYAADWLVDRAAGKPLESRQITIDYLGHPHKEPWGAERHYAYGAPLGVDLLFGDTPMTGTA